MRFRRASASYGTVNQRPRLTHETLLLGVVAVIVLWVVVSLVQAIMLERSLSHQADDLRRQNAALQSTNDSYRHDITAISSGAAAEEEARQSGYARPDEKIVVIGTPAPAPAAARPRRPAGGGPGAFLGALIHFFTGLPAR